MERRRSNIPHRTPANPAIAASTASTASTAASTTAATALHVTEVTWFVAVSFDERGENARPLLAEYVDLLVDVLRGEFGA